MVVIDDLKAAFRTTGKYARAFLAVHMAVQLIAIAIITPLASALLAAAIATSHQSALTDQDIARFLLTPWGFAAGLAVASLTICTLLLDLAVMTAVLRIGAGYKEAAIGPYRSLSLGLHLVLSRSRSLVHFGGLVVLRVLMITAPFAAVAGGIAFVTLSDYDINYYLTYMPPDFVAGALCIAVLGLALALVLLERLSGWSIALHFVLFQNMSPSTALAESAARLKGRKIGVVSRLAAWAGVRVLLAMSLTAVAGALLAAVPEVLGTHLKSAALASLLIVLLLVVAQMVLAALCNGALADLLNRVHLCVTPDSPTDRVPSEWRRTAGKRPMTVIAGITVAALVAGLYFADYLLDQVGTDRSVVVIAHRGAAGSRPENTLASVRKAVEDGADWVEIDVQEISDGTVVVAHDSDFMKLGGNPLKVWNATLDDLAQIDIGSWYDPSYAQERTPSLREVLETVKGRGKVMIELKYYGHDMMLEQRVADIVEETGMSDDISIMSLKYPGVQKMRALRPDWRYGVLAATAIGDLSRLDADFLAVNAGQVSLRLIKRAHKQGKQVYVWTVDDPVAMSRMISMGVDGLITNQPALAREVIEARKALSTPERLILWVTDRFRIGSFDLVAQEKDA